MEAGATDAPGAVLDFAELNGSIDTFTQRFDRYVQDTVASSEEARLATETARLEAHERAKALEREREATKHAQKQLWESRWIYSPAVASEREADARLRASVHGLHAQRTALEQRTASLTKELGEIRAQIAERSARKESKVQRLREQMERNAPELAALETYTGCRIRRSERGGTIQFVFTLLQPEDPARSMSLDIDVSQTKYTVPRHDPLLPDATVRTLLKQLNATDDFHTFVKALRRAMQEAIR